MDADDLSSNEPSPHDALRAVGGRPLDPSRDEALHTAALELLAAIGYDRLTMDAVAARAHAGKATLYRRWSGKAELVVDALDCAKGSYEVPDTGALRSDLEALACGAMGTSRPFEIQVMVGLVTALPRDDELRRVFRERLIEPRVAGLKVVIERAVQRGEIPKVANLDLIGTLFPALVLHQMLILGEEPDGDFIEHVIDDVVLPLIGGASQKGAPAMSPGSRRSRT